MKKNKPGKLVIISSPSGGGKTSICRRLLTPSRRKQNWQFSLSYTTRSKRKGEKNGREYRFVTDSEFNRLAKKNFFAEHFKVHLYRYGTPKKPLEDVINKGGVMIFDVDVQGAHDLRKKYPDAISIFILPPSIKELKKRLKKRGTETVEQLKVRFNNAANEMKLYHKFGYVVVNDELDKAVNEVLSIINCHHCRTDKIKLEQIKKIIGLKS